MDRQLNTSNTIIHQLLDKAENQSYPVSTLYMVATPIGNLTDISVRALHVLGMVDLIACEDTRHTKNLLNSYGIQKPLQALHQHNEMEAGQGLLAVLREGKSVAYVSDAGTPAISDPGAKLAALVLASGHKVVPIPGACSFISLLSASGVVTESGAFVFAGFAPSKKTERQEWLQKQQENPSAVVFLESPHRIHNLAEDLKLLGKRKISLGRELTKQHEEIATLACDEVSVWLERNAQRSKGEFCLALHAAQAAGDQQHAGEKMLARMMQEGLALKVAVKLAAEFSGQAKNALYEKALELKNQSGQSS